MGVGGFGGGEGEALGRVRAGCGGDGEVCIDW